MNRGVSDLKQSSDEKRLSEFMKKAQRGDAASYRLLFTEIEKMTAKFVKNSFYRLGIGESSSWEDITQDILLSVHAKRATYDPNQFFLPWLYAIARYKIIDHLRSVHRTSKFIDLELDLAELDLTGSQNEEAATQRDLESLLECLPQKQRQVLELVKIQGLTIAEAATKTGFGTSDIKVTIHRAIKTLKERLQGEILHEKP